MFLSLPIITAAVLADVNLEPHPLMPSACAQWSMAYAGRLLIRHPLGDQALTDNIGRGDSTKLFQYLKSDWAVGTAE